MNGTTLQTRLFGEILHGAPRVGRMMGQWSNMEITIACYISDDVRVRYVGALRSMSVLCGNRRQRNMHTGLGFEESYLSFMMGAVVCTGLINTTWPGTNLCGSFEMCLIATTALIFFAALSQCPVLFGTGMAETNSNRMATRVTRAIGKCIIDWEKLGQL